MHSFKGQFWLSCLIVLTGVIALPASLRAQSGNAGSISGTVVDPSSAVVPNATVEIRNPVSGYTRTATTDNGGRFTFNNVPFNPYHLTVTAQGFMASAQDVDVRSTVPTAISVALAVAGSSTSVTVEASAADLLENDPTFHTDVDRSLFDKLPLESQSSSVSSLVTLASPGIAADSNGLFHGLGDHAENSFSVDGQPITDQQSKVFSNQIPLDSIQSLEVISGAPPAEYGDKTSVVINVTTRSGQGMTTPKGAITTSYGTFGTSNVDANLGYGGANWGNFIAVNGLNTGRFLDPPEFRVFHDKGNEQNLFDRVDYQFSQADTLHLNVGFTRSWFQNPDSYDGIMSVTLPDGAFVDRSAVGTADQRAKIVTYNVAPSWSHILSPATAFTLGAFVRRDQYDYYPSRNPLADLGPIQLESVAQGRRLTNSGIRSDLSYVKGIHNFKGGVTYQQTFLTEKDNLGIVDPMLNDPASPGFNPVLAPYDLTRGGTYFPFHGHTDVKELALFLEDTISKGNWSFKAGIRGDLYNGLSTAREAEPRLGLAYNIKQTNTVLRASYARLLETPFNENLVVSSTGCNVPVIAALVPCVPAALNPGFRNEFHTGLQQAIGKYAVASVEYIWKYTHNGYDFSDLGNTPIFFPIEWHNSKIAGFAGRVSVPSFHGFSALMVFSGVNARFLPPQAGGLGVTVGQSGQPFRIDHDEKFNQTTHLQYQPSPKWPWLGFNWRYDSGLVAGAVPLAPDAMSPVDTSGLTADQQFQAGLFCGNVHATPTVPIPTPCPNSMYGSSLISIPAPGTDNPDHNPPRIAPRSLFDLAIGDDNIFHGDRYMWSAQLAVINLANKYALYNLLSTFSGTHYVTPRTITMQIGFHF